MTVLLAGLDQETWKWILKSKTHTTFFELCWVYSKTIITYNNVKTCYFIWCFK